MAQFREQWIDDQESGIGLWSDISSAAGGLVGADPIRGFSLIIGGAIFNESIASWLDSGCFLPSSGDIVLPSDADPPFPPVYPYLFSTDYIYGRDNLSLNLKMVKGDTYAFSAVVLLDGEPFNLSSCVVRMTAKWSVADADNDAVFQLSSVTGGIVIDSAPDGEITCTIGSALTSSLPKKKLELPYDIQVVTATGNVYTVLYGTLTIVPDVTLTA